VIATPDVTHGPLALLAGTFEEKLEKARRLGYDGVELMVRDPSKLDADEISSALGRHGLEAPQCVTGALFGTDGLALVHPDPIVCETARRPSVPFGRWPIMRHGTAFASRLSHATATRSISSTAPTTRWRSWLKWAGPTSE